MVEIITLVKVIVFGAGCFAAFVFLFVGLRLLQAPKNDYDRNRARIGSFKDMLFGRVKTVHDGGRDYRVRAGLAVDTKNNAWVEQGTLSEEALDSVLNAHHANS